MTKAEAISKLEALKAADKAQAASNRRHNEGHGGYTGTSAESTLLDFVRLLPAHGLCAWRGETVIDRAEFDELRARWNACVASVGSRGVLAVQQAAGFDMHDIAQAKRAFGLS